MSEKDAAQFEPKQTRGRKSSSASSDTERRPRKEKSENKTPEKKRLYQPLAGVKYSKTILYRRAALGLLPDVQDPDSNKKMKLSPLKSSREYWFTDDQLTARCQNGYRVCRATKGFTIESAGPKKDKYYWEFTFINTKEDPKHKERHFTYDEPSEDLQKLHNYHDVGGNTDSDIYPNAHVRLGIATVMAKIDFPVGGDDRGYAVRDLGGGFHNRKKVADTPSFNCGQVIGFGYEIVDEERSCLHMWIDGEYKGVVFDNINAKLRWFPAFSCYKGAAVHAEFRFFENIPEGFTPAYNIQKETRKWPIPINDMVYHMNKLDSSCPKNVLRAIDIAMIPYPELPN